MSTIGYRNRFYQARQTMPRLDSPKAAPPPQAANEPRAGELNEQSPPPVTPDSANSLNSSSKAPPPPGDTQNSETLLTLIDSELWRNGQPTGRAEPKSSSVN
jgi:hypothetical protein